MIYQAGDIIGTNQLIEKDLEKSVPQRPYWKCKCLLCNQIRSMSLKKQNNFINKLAVSLLISCAFIGSVYAENKPDFSFISLSEPKPIRLERSATPLDASLIMNNENDFFARKLTFI